VTSPDRDALLAELAGALAWSGRLVEAESLGREVLAGRIDPSAAVSFRSALMRALTWQGRPAEALAHSGLQADEPADGRDGAMLAAETALAAMFTFDFPSAVPMAARAEQLARASGNEVALCQALSVQAYLAHFLGRPHDAVELAQQAMAIADNSKDGTAHLANPYFFAGLPLMVLDRMEEGDRILQNGRRRAEEMGHMWSLPLYHSHLGGRKFITGEWDAAIAEFEAGFAIADEIHLSNNMLASASAWLCVIQVHRDELEAAERTIAQALSRMAEGGPQGGNLFNWARAALHEAKGETAEAMALLQGAWDMYMAGANKTDPWSAMALVRLCVREGDVDRARALLPVIERQATAMGTAFMHGQVLRCRGLVNGDPDMLLEAVAHYRQCPRLLELAGGCEDAGVLLASADRLEEAVPLWDEALELYEGLRADRDVARVGAYLRQRGIKRGTRRRHVRATSGWESLTGTEVKVTGLVAQGLSNPEVAERLFISRHTVESHLKHIYRKLGLSSRLKLATVAVAHAGEVLE
jgi:DNA-binding CsgD family transcriptional regulator